ncbi:MAG: transketolase family protein [Firmicutes bacterium]|nr:transketolase family protein [Bacillota bacterium]
MPKAIREIYGETLVELGAAMSDIVALDADVSSSTKSAVFGKAYPERFFNMGIAESNMVATAAGLSAVEKIPFVNAFATFLTTLGLLATRAQICYGTLNVKLAGGHSGLSGGQDGATHHATEDIAFMRALPNMTVLVPSDAACTRWATRWAAAYRGPVYLRLNREAYPDLYGAEAEFAAGHGSVVRDGKDVTVIACGILVHKALEAAEELEQSGVSVRVVDMYSIKPIDEELILECARKTGAIVTAEEHNIHGGLGGAVAEVLAKYGCAAPTEFVALQDSFTESGDYGDLLAKYGLDKDGVRRGIAAVLDRKK